MVTCVPVRMKKILQVAGLFEHSLIHSVTQTALFIHQNPYAQQEFFIPYQLQIYFCSELRGDRD